MEDKEKKESENSEESTDKNIVEETIDQIMPGLGKLVNRLKLTAPELESRLNEADIEIKKRIQDGYSGKPKVSYSYNIRTLSQESRVKSPERKKEPGFTEPVVDVIKYDNSVRVIAELPGVTEDEIKLEIKEKSINLEAKSSSRRYRKIIPLPGRVALIEQRFINGIFEANFEMTDD
ncbi:Hsp20/alpha crystallin family protein [Methanoplanus endosymbiosus]|uniref:SHSP domain-containing protein n=1 Tax=Methanoplanus endosymbiosus TaxID=33865 RepID=A0A9E7PQB8_9EURY|nr:hypothetical protein [Methanoplanus endosymbiosus]UUX93054.1 hypothetical protein L6E24_02740 [Methanoplanus endosymbiosus]